MDRSQLPSSQDAHHLTVLQSVFGHGPQLPVVPDRFQWETDFIIEKVDYCWSFGIIKIRSFSESRMLS